MMKKLRRALHQFHLMFHHFNVRSEQNNITDNAQAKLKCFQTSFVQTKNLQNSKRYLFEVRITFYRCFIFCKTNQRLLFRRFFRYHYIHFLGSHLNQIFCHAFCLDGNYFAQSVTRCTKYMQQRQWKRNTGQVYFTVANLKENSLKWSRVQMG